MCKYSEKSTLIFFTRFHTCKLMSNVLEEATPGENKMGTQIGKR